ncbi:MAG: type III polyketide synthase [Deltaproteobacteria bacterium]|nr:type III polyketide synthase [Deltaproteobacteria bacterium]
MSAPAIVAVGTALPPHFASQEVLLERFRAAWGARHFNLERLEQLHRSVRVGGRHLALPIEQYEKLTSFAQRNDAFIESATQVGEAALMQAFERAGMSPRELDAIFFVTVTGIATPSIEARLANKLKLRSDLKRTPIFGLGCVAGAAGIARASDYVRAFPQHKAALLSVELCSLTLQLQDLSIANIIASGLFGDGAAAVILGARQDPSADATARSIARARTPEIIATRSVLYPDTERVMGWDVVDSGFKVVLSPEVPKLVLSRIRGDVDAFLTAHGLARKDIAHWVCHSGGPKVLEAFQTALELPEAALARTWTSLRELGNLSSASVLFVLGDLLASNEPKPGEWGLLLAMGPGFCSELVLLRW